MILHRERIALSLEKRNRKFLMQIAPREAFHLRQTGSSPLKWYREFPDTIGAKAANTVCFGSVAARQANNSSTAVLGRVADILIR